MRQLESDRHYQTTNPNVLHSKLLLGTSSYSDELQENVKVTHSVFQRLREPFAYLFVMCTLMIMMSLHSCCSNMNTNDMLFLCNMKLLQRVTWLRNASLAWLKLSWNCTAVWDLPLNPSFLSACKCSDLCFPPRTPSAYSYSLPLYPSQLLPSLAHLTHLGICFLEDPNSWWPWFLYYLTKQNQGNPWCINEF